MTESVDLTGLRAITGGDVELEKELFQAFLESGRQCLALLETSWQAGSEKTWREQAHALKGLAFNLGAKPLGELCKTAQNSAEAGAEVKCELLKAIQAEFGNVVKFLETL